MGTVSFEFFLFDYRQCRFRKRVGGFRLTEVHLQRKTKVKDIFPTINRFKIIYDITIFPAG